MITSMTDVQNKDEEVSTVITYTYTVEELERFQELEGISLEEPFNGILLRYPIPTDTPIKSGRIYAIMHRILAKTVRRDKLSGFRLCKEQFLDGKTLYQYIGYVPKTYRLV